MLLISAVNHSASIQDLTQESSSIVQRTTCEIGWVVAHSIVRSKSIVAMYNRPLRFPTSLRTPKLFVEEFMPLVIHVATLGCLKYQQTQIGLMGRFDGLIEDWLVLSLEAFTSPHSMDAACLASVLRCKRETAE